MSVVTLLLLLPVVSRGVGTEAYGVYLLFMSIALLLQSDLGLGSATVAQLARALQSGDEKLAKSIVTTSSVIFFGLGSLVTLIYAGIAVFAWPYLGIPSEIKGAASVTATLAGLQCLLTLSGAVSRHVLTAGGRLDLANLTQVLAAMIRIPATVLAVALGGNIAVVACVDTVVVAGITLALWLVRRRIAPELGAQSSALSSAAVGRALRVNRGFVVMALAGTVVMQAPSLILSITAGVASVAIFGAAFRIYQLCKEATNALALALLPNASQSASNLDALRELFLVGTRYANALCLVAVIPVLVSGETLMEIWAGEVLAEGFDVAVILVAGLLISTNHLVATAVMSARGHVGGYAALHVGWATLSVAGGVLLSPAWGATGMAIAISAPLVLLEPLYLRLILRELDLPAIRFIREAVLSPFGSALPLLGGFAILSWRFESNTNFVQSVCLAAVSTTVFILLFIWLDRRNLRALVSPKMTKSTVFFNQEGSD